MIYATYDNYTQSYGGSVIPEAGFQRLAVKASVYIDMFTFGRINEGNVSAFPSLSLCACEMAEAIFFTTGENGNKKEKKSESIDGYSVSYVAEGADGQTTEETLKRKLYAIAKSYLINTGLLYCGVDDLC